ncbi:PrsW family intramembrane metalloprotease [Candidatus Bathyarchaeota archaeon]|nr:PrsW family intramembrane metalloprotease [Candidatus Bathyarchaeota archaeon]
MSPDDKFCQCCGKSLKQLEGIVYSAEPSKPSLQWLLEEAFTSLIRSNPLKKPPHVSVFQNREPTRLTPYLVWAVAFVAAGLFASYGGRWYGYLGFTLAGYAGPIIYLIWMVRSDLYEREPLALVAYCFGWGAFSGIAAGVLNVLITARYFGVGGAGFIEEPLKVIGVYLIAKSSHVKSEFNDPLDGMVYGAAAGAGFAGLENFWYLTEMIMNNNVPPFTVVLVRSITGFMHLAWTAIAGRSLGVAKAMKGEIELVDLLPGVAVSAVIHMLWNLSPTIVAFSLILPFMVTSLQRQVRTALDDERRWCYHFFAPDEGANLEG